MRIAERYEITWGRGGDRHFCVSEAMRLDLADRFEISAEALYDRPVRLLTPAVRSSGRLVAVCPAGVDGGRGYGDAARRNRA